MLNVGIGKPGDLPGRQKVQRGQSQCDDDEQTNVERDV
jgi:hypothetical protein